MDYTFVVQHPRCGEYQTQNPREYTKLLRHVGFRVPQRRRSFLDATRASFKKIRRHCRSACARPSVAKGLLFRGSSLESTFALRSRRYTRETFWITSNAQWKSRIISDIICSAHWSELGVPCTNIFIRYLQFWKFRLPILDTIRYTTSLSNREVSSSVI